MTHAGIELYSYAVEPRSKVSLQRIISNSAHTTTPTSVHMRTVLPTRSVRSRVAIIIQLAKTQAAEYIATGGGWE